MIIGLKQIIKISINIIELMAKSNDFELETILEYKNQDGSRGWFILVKSKKNG